MAATTGESSYGAVVNIKDPKDAVSYTQLAGIIEGELPKPKKDSYEVKQLDQGDRWKKFRGSFVDGGQLTLKFQYAKAKLAKLYSYVYDPDPYPVQISLADGGVATFNALVLDAGTPIGADGGELQSDVTIQISGSFTFA